jgi:hypothetical protein
LPLFVSNGGTTNVIEINASIRSLGHVDRRNNSVFQLSRQGGNDM